MVVLDAKPLGLLVDVADHFLVAHLGLELDPLVAVHTVDLATRVYQARNRPTDLLDLCLLYTSPSPRDKRQSRMPSSA